MGHLLGPLKSTLSSRKTWVFSRGGFGGGPLIPKSEWKEENLKKKEHHWDFRRYPRLSRLLWRLTKLSVVSHFLLLSFFPTPLFPFITLHVGQLRERGEREEEKKTSAGESRGRNSPTRRKDCESNTRNTPRRRRISLFIIAPAGDNAPNFPLFHFFFPSSSTPRSADAPL